MGSETIAVLPVLALHGIAAYCQLKNLKNKKVKLTERDVKTRKT